MVKPYRSGDPMPQFPWRALALLFGAFIVALFLIVTWSMFHGRLSR